MRPSLTACLSAFRAQAGNVRVLGVDDFGFRKGNAPGTIFVDHERRRIVDLFEGHSVESIAGRTCV
jgi:hypothetical protein